MQVTVGKRYRKKTPDKLLAKTVEKPYNMCVAQMLIADMEGVYAIYI